MIGKIRWHCNRALEQHFNVKKHGMVDRWSTYWWITMHKIFRSMMSKLSRWHCDRVEWQYLNLKTCYHEWNRYWKTGRHDIFTCMISMLSTWHCNRVDTLQDIICMLYPYHGAKVEQGPCGVKRIHHLSASLLKNCLYMFHHIGYHWHQVYWPLHCSVRFLWIYQCVQLYLTCMEDNY